MQRIGLEQENLHSLRFLDLEVFVVVAFVVYITPLVYMEEGIEMDWRYKTKALIPLLGGQ